MDWVEHAIWWQVYPLGFCGAPIRDPEPTPAPRLRRLMGWLDYAIELGTSGLLLGPVFASQTHGYDTVDQFRIDPRLGGEEDFDALVAACSQRGLRLLLDGVFSHVGAQHPDVIRALDEGPGGPTADLFDIDWNAPGGPAPRVFEGHASLVRLNHASERAVQYVTAVMEHWLARGIDGWRLDAAYSVDTGFWARVIPAVRGRHPNAWFLGEVIHGDHSRFVASSGLDATTQYELWKAIWSSIKDRNFFELGWALNRHNGFLAHFTPNTFIGNHDVTRIASVIGSDGAVMALAILLTLGGIPSILLRRRTGIHRHQGRTDRRGRRHPAGLPRQPLGAGRLGPEHPSRPPGPHRAAAPQSLARHRHHDAPEPGEHPLHLPRSRERRKQPPGRRDRHRRDPLARHQERERTRPVGMAALGSRGCGAHS